jgi:hypothetical protein
MIMYIIFFCLLDGWTINIIKMNYPINIVIRPSDIRYLFLNRSNYYPVPSYICSKF